MTVEQDYLARWEADVLLRDGRTAHLRPISPADAELLVEFYSQVSDQSKYFRFFAPMPNLSERDVERFTHVDYDQRVAFVLTVADKIVAVGRYDVISEEPDSRAEVAFLVQDQHQGRGMGQILLEHLAQAARERGVKRFVAEVLPDNRRMIQVFRDQGYQVTGGWDEGVMHLEFDIDPTETAMGVISAREHRSEAASIAAFLNARSVAVIGASRRSDTIGALLVRNLVLGDYAGRVYVVNPAADAVAGMPAYATVSDIPGDIDVAVVAVPADAVQDVVLDCANKGVHGLVVISSGFAETGEEGRKRQRKLLGPGPVVRVATDRAQLPRHHQHRLGGVAERLAGAGDAAAGARGLLLPVGRAGLGDPGQGAWPRAGPVHVRQRGQPRRRLRQRPPAVLGGGRRHRGDPALPRVDR